MKFVILHGTDADHNENWFPWLKTELESLGHEVWVPDLPQTHTPNASIWTQYLIDSGYDFSDTVLIGHSSGAVQVTALLQVLNKETVVHTGLLVGVFRGDLGWDALKAMDIPFDYPLIKQKAGQFIVVHSDDDPHCPLEGAQYIADQLDAEFILMSGMNHFSKGIDPRFERFPELLELINQSVA